MNDTSTQSAGIPENIAQHFADLTEACARSSELMAKNLTLREVASNLLISTVRAINLKVCSPDALFFNRPDGDQQIVSIAMPDLLVDVMRHGDSVMEEAGAAFFTRHDSLDAEHALSDGQNQELREAVVRFSGTLSETYQAHLEGLWQKPVVTSEHLESAVTTVDELIQQQGAALDTELALCGFAQLMSTQEQKRLSRVIEGHSTDGVFGLEWTAADGSRKTVPSAYVVSESVENDGQPSGVVFLVMPARGIERFESVALLREGLSSKLAGSLKDSLLIRDLTQLGEQGTVDPDAWTFERLNDPLIQTHVHQVRHKQTHDCQFLLARDGEPTDRNAFYTQLQSVQVCAHLDEGMGQRFNSWMARLSEMAEPDWRKYGDAEQKAHLLRLEQAHDDRKKAVDALLGHLHSLETFAYSEMTQYMRQHLGRVIDPSRVRIHVHDTIELRLDDALNTVYEYSLLEFAVKGVSIAASRMRFSPSPDQLHADFSGAFVKQMLDTLNLHVRYEKALEQRLNDESVLRAMTHHRDSAIALGAHAAKMQGHLLQERSHDLVHLIRGDKAPAGTVHTMGSLHLAATDSRLRDVIVIKERTHTDEHYVLYAPGAPGGRDFFEFGSWRRLSFHIGGWLADEAGRNYLHGQLFGPSKAGAIAFLNEAQLNAALWTPDSCRLVSCTGQNFESNLSSLVRQKALGRFPFFNGEARPAADLPSSANASVLAMLNVQITALNNVFAKLSPEMMTLRDYIHKETSRLLNEYLQSVGYPGHIDPDTLYLALGIPFTETPDFGKNSELRSLTELMMYGSEDIKSYSPLIHLYSSAGTDVKALPVNLISFLDKQVREADLAARYMKYLTDEFLGRQHPLHKRRKALIAKRIQCEMSRGALLTFQQRHLSLAQYTWLRKAIDGLSVDAPVVAAVEHTAVSVFKIANQTIEGVYIFRDFNRQDPDYNLLYTPGAPDGLDFRPLSDYAQLLSSEKMQRYFASRVSHAGEKRVRIFLDEFVRGSKYDPDFIRIHNRPENRITNIEQLYGEMFERMIADVDSQTESVAEKRFALAYTIIRWTGTIVFIPFPGLNVPWGLMMASLTIVEAVDAYESGDRAAALPLFIEGAVGLVLGGGGAKDLIKGVDGLTIKLATKAGRWAWKKYDLGVAYRLPA
ncbi:dermonecrotic toxin domain-containing protein [Pseudomonas abietaniphila]|uniref:dermonecrotic toxin domain-containing protein n=1 Tax=Pseudomonas abietaniphila TaxID=89065 RepID=UPI0007822E86|nr:DUF6543 domain-containing protein [Pseudomonas abietaniphila]